LSTFPSALVFAPALDFAPAVAQALIARHRHELPDLSRLKLLVPHAGMIAPLRTALAEAAGGSVLAPQASTLRAFAATRAPQALAPLHCRLRLAEEIARHASIFPEQDPQRAADALFDLAEELTLAQTEPSLDESAFTLRLRRGYGAPDSHWLSREAQIVHRLWLAYRESFGEAAPAAAYALGLFRSATAEVGPVYWIGFDRLDGCERAALRRMLNEGRAAFWTQGRLAGRDGAATRSLFDSLGIADPGFIEAPPSGRGSLLDAGLSSDAGAPGDRRPATAVGGHGLRLVTARDPEHEARCVDLAVREALLSGATRVAIVTSDRRLARRLRALLERAGIALHDRIGWPLSTSRAAAAVDAWISVVETDFHYRPLFNLLRSGFFGDEGTEAEAADLLAMTLVYGKPSVIGGIRQWQQALHTLANPGLTSLLDRLQRAAGEIRVGSRPRAANEWPAALRRSLHSAGLLQGLGSDQAGARMLDELALLEATLSGLAQPMGWHAFRILLDRRLEEARFGALAPAGSTSPRVTLHALEQTQGLRADALIFAGLTPSRLPPPTPSTPFFNATVRCELGLEGRESRYALGLLQFRRLIEAAPVVVLSHAPESVGEPATLAPWVDALSAYASAAGAPLQDLALARRAARPDTEIVNPSTAPRPAQPAAPPAEPGLIDGSLSATAHQALIDCPYRFHARHALQLVAPQPPDAPASRADFGDIVHRILKAFYQPVAGLPEPWRGALAAAETSRVEDHLGQLAQAAFADEVRKRPLAELWYREFLALVPWLAGRLIERGDSQVDVEARQDLDRAGWRLLGTADRIEARPEGRAIIDYKTGHTPDPAAIASGEAVQLPHYALLFGGARAVEYWDLKRARIVGLEGTALAELLPAVERRLLSIANRLQAGIPMPASGEHHVCERCEYSGLCRRWALPRGSA